VAQKSKNTQRFVTLLKSALKEYGQVPYSFVQVNERFSHDTDL